MVIFLASLTAIVGVLGLVMLLRQPMWAFVLVIVLFAMEQVLQSYFPVFQKNSTLFNYLVAILASLAVLLRVARRDPIMSGFNNTVTYLIYAQFLLWLLAMLYSPASDAALVNLGSCWPYVILLLVVTPFLVLDLAEIRQTLVGTMAVGSVIALLILCNPKSAYHGGRLMLDLGMTGMSRDQYGNPLAVAELGGMVALIGALMAPAAKHGLFTALRLAAFVLGLGLAIGSGSRGQVLATVVAGVLFYPLARRVNSIRTFFLTTFGVLVLASGMYLIFSLFVGDQNRARWDATLMIKDIGLRFEMVWTYLEAWLASPSHWLFGLGTNAWVDITGAAEVHGNYVHNIAIEILCEQGLVGAAIFVATLTLTIRAGLKTWRLHRDDPAMRSAVAILMALGAFCLFGALKQGTITSAAPFYLWLVLAKVARREEIMAASDPWLAHAHHGDDRDLDYAPARGYAIAP